MKPLSIGGMAELTAGLKEMRMRLHARVMRAYRCHKAETELMAASDEMLKDIGISRGEIVNAVWGLDDGVRYRR